MKMKPMCDKCWVEKHKCLDYFYELFEALIDCLEAIATEQDWDSKAKTVASGLLFQITSSTFLCVQLSTLFIWIYQNFEYPFARQHNIDFVTAYEKVKLAHYEIMHVQNNAEDEVHSIIEKATVMAETAGTTTNSAG